MTDNTNQSPLFWDMTESSAPVTSQSSASAPVSAPAKADSPLMSDSLATILWENKGTPPEAPASTTDHSAWTPSVSSSADIQLPNTRDSMATILDSLATTPPPKIPSADLVTWPSIDTKKEVETPLSVPEKKTETISTPPVPEILPYSEPSSTLSPPAAPSRVQTPGEDARLKHYLEEDTIYRSMLKVIDADRIRLHLAIRYMILMFAIFLVIVWVVNNRIIMFGFSEFQWLARIRDWLFGVIAGLFSLTLWFGSEVWFHKWPIVWFFRILSLLFFVAVISALYFPLW